MKNETQQKIEDGISDDPHPAPGAAAIRLLAGKTRHRGTRRDVSPQGVHLSPRPTVADKIEDRREAEWSAFPADL